MYLNENAITLLGYSYSVDMNPGAPPVQTNIFTIPPDKTGCIVTHVVCRNSSGNLTTAQFSFGFDAAGSDCIANALHAALDGSTKYIVLKAEDGAVRGIAAGIFKISVNTAQGGAMTLDVEVFGYYY